MRFVDLPRDYSTSLNPSDVTLLFFFPFKLPLFQIKEEIKKKKTTHKTPERSQTSPNEPRGIFLLLWNSLVRTEADSHHPSTNLLFHISKSQSMTVATLKVTLNLTEQTKKKIYIYI